MHAPTVNVRVCDETSDDFLMKVIDLGETGNRTAGDLLRRYGDRTAEKKRGSGKKLPETGA